MLYVPRLSDEQIDTFVRAIKLLINEEAKEELIESFSIPKAILLNGPTGSGKTTVACLLIGYAPRRLFYVSPLSSVFHALRNHGFVSRHAHYTHYKKATNGRENLVRIGKAMRDVSPSAPMTLCLSSGYVRSGVLNGEIPVIDNIGYTVHSAFMARIARLNLMIRLRNSIDGASDDIADGRELIQSTPMPTITYNDGVAAVSSISNLVSNDLWTTLTEKYLLDNMLESIGQV